MAVYILFIMELSATTYSNLRHQVYLNLTSDLKQEAEDITHWIILDRLRGKRLKQTTRQAVIDILRKHYGIKRTTERKSYYKPVFRGINPALERWFKTGSFETPDIVLNDSRAKYNFRSAPDEIVIEL